MKLKNVFEKFILWGLITCCSGINLNGMNWPQGGAASSSAAASASASAPVAQAPVWLSLVMQFGGQAINLLGSAASAVGKAAAEIIDESEPLRTELANADIVVTRLEREVLVATWENQNSRDAVSAASLGIAQQRLVRAQAGRDDISKRLKDVQQRVSTMKSKSAEFVESLPGIVTEEFKKEIDHKRETEKVIAATAVKANVEARALIESSKAKMEAIINFLRELSHDKKRLLMYVGLALLLVGGTFGLWYGADLASKYVQLKMGRPRLVRESSRASFKQAFIKTFKALLLGAMEESEAVLSDIVLAPEVQEYIYTLAEDTRQTRELGLPYQNVLFYGPPGTGKTEFARILAKYSDMDYAILSGADFSQFKNGEGITELHKLFTWANKSKRGLIIFIDEADACLRDRTLLDRDGINLVNAFLSQTGCSSNKFMIVLATNHEVELDAAVRSRIHKKFAFVLPALDERYKIFMLKLNKYVINDKRRYIKDNDLVEVSLIVDPVLTEDFWRGIAKRTDGFSGRDIDQAVAEMRMRAYRSGQNILTKEIVEYVIKQKIETIQIDKNITEYQRKKFEKETGLVRDTAPNPAVAL